MKLIVGLGNPGKKYLGTRHNVGFMVLDEIAKMPEILAVEKKSLKFCFEKKFKAEIATATARGEKIVLVKPQTFVNLSGESVTKIAHFYKIKPKNTWIVVDDVELPLGTIRIRLKGSSGGHKGLESLINGLGAENFPRIRIGVAPVVKPLGPKEFEHFAHKPILDMKKFVLESFNKRELPVVRKTVRMTAQLIYESLERKELTAHTLDIF